MKVTSTKDVSAGSANILVYARSGAGKTKLAATMPDNHVIYNIEGGLLSISDYEIDTIKCEGITAKDKINHLREFIGWAVAQKYEAITFDSLTEISEMFVEFAASVYPEERNALQKWGNYTTSFKAFLKYVRDLDITIYFTCLEKDVKDEIGIKATVPDVAGSLAVKINALFDYVFTIVEQDIDDKKVRMLLTANHGKYCCKDRSGKLNTYEPMNLGAIINKVRDGVQ